MSRSEQTPQLFVSYSHRDQRFMERFQVHLAPLEQNAKIEIWSDKQIGAGDNWQDAVMASLSRATIAVLQKSST